MGTDKEIAKFCESNYNVKFDMLSKVVVKGDGICPLYEFLSELSLFFFEESLSIAHS